MGINILPRVQSKRWYHVKEDVGASNWNKSSIEACALQVKNLMNS